MDALQGLAKWFSRAVESLSKLLGIGPSTEVTPATGTPCSATGRSITMAQSPRNSAQHPACEQDDILISIFSYLEPKEILSGASLASRQWHRVGTGAQVWKGTDASFKGLVLRDRITSTLVFSRQPSSVTDSVRL